MKQVRVHNLQTQGSWCVCAIAASILLLPGIVKTVSAAPSQQHSVINPPTDQINVEQIDQWISQLTSDDFGTREWARDQLLGAGVEALPRLKQHFDTTNNELRLSVTRLFETISEEIAANQIQSFLENKTSLAGWQNFQAHFGDTSANRQLYAGIFRTDQKLLEQLELTNVSFADVLESLIRSQQSELAHNFRPNTRQLPILALVISELFGKTEQSTTPASQHIPLQIQLSLCQVVLDPEFQRWIDMQQPSCEFVLKSLVDWVSSETDSPILISSKINVSNRMGIRESIPLCLKCLESRDVPAISRRMSMELIVRFGDSHHILALEKHIADPLIVYREVTDLLHPTESAVDTCQMGDVALASAILISGQDLNRFGFEKASVDNSKSLPTTDKLVFSNDDARQKSRQQWREFRAAGK